MKRTQFLKYLAALLLFGSNGVAASRISLSSMEIVLLRVLFGSVLLLAFFLLSGGRFTALRHPRQLGFLAVSGAAMGLNWVFLFEAYRLIGVSVASLLYYCGPVIVMALSPLVFRERLTWPKLLGFAAVLCGLLLVSGRVSATGGSRWGLFCGMMSAVLYAVMLIFNKKASAIVGLENAAIQLFAAFAAVAVVVGARQGFSIAPAAADWAPILLLGVVNTGLGCYLYFSAIGCLPVQTVAICGYLEPLSAVLFSVLLLGETLAPAQVIGAVLILGGAAFGELAKPAAFGRRAASQ